MGQRNVDINLYPKQAYCIASEALMSLFMGGVGSGKTHAGAVKVLMLSLRFPNESGLIVVNTYPQLRHSTFPPFFKILDEANIGYNWSEGKKELYIFAGKKLTIRPYSLDKPGRVRGQTVPWVWTDEARDMEWDSFEELLKRTRGTRDYLPVFITTSPPEIPHWLYDTFEGKIDGANKYMIKAYTTENKYLSQTYTNRLFANLSAERVAQEIYAEWGIRGEKVFLNLG